MKLMKLRRYNTFKELPINNSLNKEFKNLMKRNKSKIKHCYQTKMIRRKEDHEFNKFIY